MKLSPFARRLVLVIAALNLFVVAMAALWLSHSLRESRNDARRTVDNLAQVLQASLTGTVRHIDLALLTAVDEYARESRAGRVDEGAFNELLAGLLGHLPEIESLRVTDAGGAVRWGVGADPRTNLADREFFAAARDDRAAGLVIAKPVFARIAKKWVVVFARRLEDSGGRFAGVVYVNLALDRLTRDFLALDIGREGSASLRDGSLGLIVRVPATGSFEKQLGDRAVSKALEELVGTGKTAGSYLGASGFDRIERASAFRKLDPYPLFVVIGMAENDYLAGWRQEAAATALAMALFALVTLSAGYLLTRAWRRQEATADELARRELELKTIIDTEPECVKLTDAECRLLRMNSAGLRMLDAASAGDLLGHDMSLMVAAPYREAFRELIRRAFGGQPGRLAFEALTLKGRMVWLETHATPLRDPAGTIVAALGVSRDVSEQKRAEALVNGMKDELERRVAERTAQLEAANKELEEFSYSMSHDMRTPLRAINGYAHILLEEHEERLDDDGRRLLHALAENAGRMGRLIDDILRFLGMARRHLRPAAFSMEVLAREAFAAAEAGAPERRLRLELRPLPPAWGDADMLRLVLNELFGNAAKFSPPEREAVIEMSGEAKGDENVYCVRDNGIGFDMRYADKLFKVFERVHPTGAYEGTGIGLAIVKRIVDRHGGRVWAEGSVGGGAAFHFSLPQRPDAETAAPALDPR
ncbi:MAG TPA: ATP-binding protein [Rhodocyclaceae bacterium]